MNDFARSYLAACDAEDSRQELLAVSHVEGLVCQCKPTPIGLESDIYATCLRY
jgi:hypothetical protein